VGQEVRTLDVVGDVNQVGHVRLAGERWRAVSGAEVPIPPDTVVLVTAVEGTTLIVWPVDGHLPSDSHHSPPAAGEGEGHDNQEQERP
jgi:membrane-bound ClpP family serine protease